MSTGDEVAVITGASSGIGTACARLLARRGYRVVLAARREERLHALAAEIHSAGGQPLPVRADISILDDIQRLSREALSHFGQVDILINNAGYGHINWLEAMDPVEDIIPQIRTNLTGLILLTRELLPAMISRNSGHIINVASGASFIATPTYSVYAASKFGVRGFSEALRREVGIFGIQVSVVYPGTVETEFKSHMGYQRKTGLTTPPALRLQAEDVASRILTLIQRPQKVVFIPRTLRIALWINRYFPGITDRLIERRFVIPERGP